MEKINKIAMTPSFILHYLSDCNKKLGELSRKGEGNLMFLWWDFIKCSFAHGVIINHYVRGGMYKIKGCERRKAMTYGRILKAFKKMNSPESISILNEKHLFNAHFTPFVRRKWLYSDNMDFDEFKDLCCNNKMLIVKPEGGDGRKRNPQVPIARDSPTDAHIIR